MFSNTTWAKPDWSNELKKTMLSWEELQDQNVGFLTWIQSSTPFEYKNISLSVEGDENEIGHHIGKWLHLLHLCWMLHDNCPEGFFLSRIISIT